MLVKSNQALWRPQVEAVEMRLLFSGAANPDLAGMTAANTLTPVQLAAIATTQNLFAPVSSTSHTVTPSLLNSSNADGTGLTGEYFTGSNFQRAVMTRTDPTVSYSWQNGTPDTDIPHGGFSARWTGQILALYNETYTFYAKTDDGVRLWVNGELVIDEWNAQSLKETFGNIQLQAGEKYSIRMDYFKQGNGPANAQLSWSSPSQNKQVVPATVLFPDTSVVLPGGAGLTAQYFHGKSLQRLGVTRIDPNVNFNFPLGTPDSAINPGYFSARYTGQIEPLHTETYTFTALADDGVRLWVNGQELVNDWQDRAAHTDKASIALVAGQKYDIRIDYYENGYLPASLQLFWQSASTPKQIVPAWAFTTTPASSAGTLRVASVGVGQIGLSWDGSNDATGYIVQRAPAGSTTFAQVGATVAGVTTFTDSGLPAATTYVYRVVPLGSADVVTPSNTVTGADLPPAPQNPVATALSSTSIGVQWNAVASAAGYTIQRSTDGVTFSSVATLNAPTITYTDTGLLAGTTYTYRIFTNNTSGSSPASVAVSATTSVPAAPSGLTATAISTTQVNFTWARVAGATGYEVDRSANGSTGWTAIVTVNDPTAAYADTGLSAGTTYYYRVLTTTPTDSSPASSVSHATTVPTAVSGVTATATSSSAVTINWADVSGETGFTVLASSDSGAHYAQVGTTSAGVLTLNAHGLTSATTYLFEVEATNAAGSSAPSTPATATTFTGAPSGINATTISATEIDVAWNVTTGATGYIVQRSPDNTTFSNLHTINAGNTVSYADSTVVAATQYFYRVIATNGSGSSIPSSSASATTTPTGPLGLSATTISNQEIDLAWNAASGATGYDVQISTNGTTFNDLHTVGAGILNYHATALNSATQYTFRIIATDAGGPSAPGTPAAATTDADMPTNVTATPNSATQITVAWSAVTGATGYDVQKSSDGSTGWTSAGTIPGGSSIAFPDVTVSAGTQYFYRVLATNAGGSSAPSTTVNATTVPLAVTLTGNTPSSSEIDLSWLDVSGETGFSVLESTNAGTTYSSIATLSQGVLSYHATPLAAASTHYYEVTANDAGGPSVPSNGIIATTRTNAPTNLTATAVSTSQIDLAWNDVSGETGFYVDRSADGSTGWTQIGGLITHLTTSDTGLTPGTTYYYEVIAADAGGNSTPSNVASDTTVPSAPTNVAATINTTTGHITWDTMPGATSYIVQRSNGGAYAGVGTPTTTSYDDSGLSRGTTYSYKVIAVNNAGSSTASASASITTAPNAPASINAVVQSDSEIDLSWSTAATATGYILQNSSDGITYSDYQTLGVGVTSYHDTALQAGTMYYYQVIATNAAGNSPASPSTSAQTLAAAPSNFTVTDDASNTLSFASDDVTQSLFNTNGPQTADLAWNDVTGETGFIDQISTDNGGSYNNASNIPQGVASGAISSLSAGNIYYFDVIAKDLSGPSAPSTRVSLTFPPVPAYILGATADSNTQISVNFLGAYGATAHHVWRSTTNGFSGWTEIGDATSGTYVDTTVSAGTTYFYKIVEEGDGGLAGESGTASATTPLATPSANATATSNTATSITWSAISNATNYLVESSLDGSSGWATVGSTSGTSINDIALLGGTTYYYRVTASDAQTSSTSSVVSATTLPDAPSGLSVIDDASNVFMFLSDNVTQSAFYTGGTQAADLSWNDVIGENSFVDQTVPDSGTGHMLAPGTTSDVIGGLNAGNVYTFHVTAQDTSGSSAPSAQTLTFPPAPAYILNATADSSTQISVNFLGAYGATSHNVWRSTTNGLSGWTQVGTANSGTYVDTTVSSGTTYYYKIVEVGNGGLASESNGASATTP